MLWLRICLSKSSCLMLQPAASGCPVITKRAWTPPSRLPSGLYWKRASRMGPSSVMNEGTTLPVNRRSARGTRNSGFSAGLVPPTRVGYGSPHPTKLKRGPTPSVTPSSSEKSSRPTVNISASSALKPAMGPPPPVATPDAGIPGPEEIGLDDLGHPEERSDEHDE